MMEVFGTDIQTVYLITLGISGGLALIYILFNDMLDGIFDFGFNPALILTFFTFLGASGFLFEQFTSLNSILIIFLAIIISLILDILLHLFVFTPLKKAETSLVYSQSSLEGKLAKVIIPIPVDGFGEVVISNASGTISKSAVSLDGTEIKEGQEVVVIYVKDGVLVVSPYEYKK